MQEHLDVAARAICGPGAARSPCLAGAATLLLGGVCLADAFVVPGLFGPVAAAVVAAERLLCAARSSSAKAAAVWTAIAFGWIAVASCMLHAPLVSVRALEWLVVLIVTSSALGRLGSRLAANPTEPAPASVWFVVVGVVAQLATLFLASGAPLARIAAAAAMELVLIGIVGLLQAQESRREARVSSSSAKVNLSPAIKLDAGMA